MQRINIRFSETGQVAKFVRIINQYDFDADIKSGSRLVDAKSIMGVLALAKAKTVELILHTNEECGELLKAIAPFAA
jgi:phosphotransferase system HPr-like phosphotransfer protein